MGGVRHWIRIWKIFQLNFSDVSHWNWSLSEYGKEQKGQLVSVRQFWGNDSV